MSNLANYSPIFAQFGTKYGVNPNEVSKILKGTAFRVKEGVVRDEQMTALLVVANQFGLNPFLKEIYAFPDKNNGIIPVIGVDGWSRIANEHPQYDGLEFKYSEKLIKLDNDTKECPEWIECIVYRKDRTRPIIVREYVEECYQPTKEGKYGKFSGPWQSHPKRFMRHKVFIQAIRLAFGFAGIYDEDEAERIAQARVIEAENTITTLDIPALEQNVETSFNNLLNELQLVTNPTIEPYLQACVKTFNASVEEVKKQILSNPSNFEKAFYTWEKTYNAQNQSKKSKETESKAKLSTESAKYIICPNLKDSAEPEIYSTQCQNCSSRNGCPAWE